MMASTIDSFAAFAHSLREKPDFCGGEFVPSDDQFPHERTKLFLSILEKTINEFNLNVEELSDYFKDKGYRGVNVECGLISNKNANAIAATRGSRDFIGINIGFASTIWIIINLFEDKNVFLSTISGRFPIVRTEARNILSDFDDGCFGLSDLELSTENQAGVSPLFFNKALRWVLHHELAHIWNGHTGYLNNVQGDTEIGDIAGGVRESFQINDRFLMEVDADRRAGKATIDEFFASHLEDFLEYKNNGNLGKLEFFQFGILFYFVSILIVQSIFSYKSDFDSNAPSLTHPIVNSRLRLLRFGALQEFAKRGVPVQMVDDAWNYAKGAIAFGFQNCFGVDIMTTLKIVDEKAQDPRWPLFEQGWNRLFPKLLPHMRGRFLKGTMVPGKPDCYVDADGKEYPAEEAEKLMKEG